MDVFEAWTPWEITRRARRRSALQGKFCALLYSPSLQLGAIMGSTWGGGGVKVNPKASPMPRGFGFEAPRIRRLASKSGNARF